MCIMVDDYTSSQTYLKDLSEGGVNAIVAHSRTFPGKGSPDVKLIDFEPGWNINHIEFTGKTILTPHGVSAATNAIVHGTGVLGIVAAIEGNQGITGIAPNTTNLILCSIADSTDPGQPNMDNLATRLRTLIDGPDLSPGDIILIEGGIPNNLPLGHPNRSDVSTAPEVYYDITAETRPVFEEIKRAVNVKGLVVIEAAGDNARTAAAVSLDEDLFPVSGTTAPFGHLNYLDTIDEVFSAQYDSGAIMVGAFENNGETFVRWADANPLIGGSNYGTRVDCWSLGHNIVTSGESLIPGCTINPGDPENSRYREDFGGTSGAAAIIAGVALSAQSRQQVKRPSKLFNGIKMRQLMKIGGIAMTELSTDPIFSLEKGYLPDLNMMLENIDHEDPPTVNFFDSTGNTPFSSSAPASSNLDVKIFIHDDYFFDPSRVKFEIVKQHRTTSSPVTQTFTFNGIQWRSLGTATTFDIINLPEPIIADLVKDAEYIVNISSAEIIDYEFITIRVSVSDLVGNVRNSEKIVELLIPTDIMLVMDYSGSMLNDSTGQSRWQSAQEAGNIFSRLYSIFSSIQSLENRIGLVKFFSNGPTGIVQGESSMPPLWDIDPPPQLISPIPPNSNNYTPIGKGVLTARDNMGSTPEWRNRVMFVLTDGIENRPPYIHDIRSLTADPANFVPNRIDNKKNGFRIFSCAFGAPGQIDSGTIEGLSRGNELGMKSFEGQFHSTETTDIPNGPLELITKYFEFLVDILPVEQTSHIDGQPTKYNITDDTIDAIVFVVVKDNASVVRATHDSGVFIDSQHYSNEKISVITIQKPNPIQGEWTLNISGDNVFALTDLRLRTKFDMQRTDLGIGKPIKLFAEIIENFKGVKDAEVTVRIDSPEESISFVLDEYVKSPNFNIKKWQKQLGLPLSNNLLQYPTKYTIDNSCKEPQSTRKQLLDAAIDQRCKTFGIAKNNTKLKETEVAGKYETIYENTDVEGTYTFHFQARGNTRAGNSFNRIYSASSHLESIPDSNNTVFSWTAINVPTAKITRWFATLDPKTSLGKSIGPGLSHKFFLTDPKNKTNNPIQFHDNLNGKYTATITLPQSQVIPTLKLQFGSHVISTQFDPVRLKRIQLILKRIKILDDKESWFPSPGEMFFDAAITLNQDINRRMIKRIPETGTFHLKDGESQDIDQVLFDVYVEEGTTMDFSMGGTELDKLWIFTKKDKYVKYNRSFAGDISSWVDTYKPDDEPNDSESLKEWQVWYEIKLI